jgi:hypothetical protein
METDEAVATPVAKKSASESPGSSTASGGRKVLNSYCQLKILVGKLFILNGCVFVRKFNISLLPIK